MNSDVKATTDEIKPEAVVTEPEETAETAQENPGTYLYIPHERKSPSCNRVCR